MLREKRILAILDGDVDFGKIETTDSKENIKISMPYLSGPILCDISCNFGLPVTYGWNGGAQSRWTYLDDLLAHCIENHRESDLLAFLFSKEQFVKKLKGNTPEVIESAYTKVVETIIAQINGALYFGGNELVRVGDHFIIKKIGASVEDHCLTRTDKP